MFEKGSGLLDDIGVRLLQLEQNVGEGVVIGDEDLYSAPSHYGLLSGHIYSPDGPFIHKVNPQPLESVGRVGLIVERSIAVFDVCGDVAA